MVPKDLHQTSIVSDFQTERKENLRGPRLLGADGKMRWEVKHRKHIGVAGQAYQRSR